MRDGASGCFSWWHTLRQPVPGASEKLRRKLRYTATAAHAAKRAHTRIYTRSCEIFRVLRFLLHGGGMPRKRKQEKAPTVFWYFGYGSNMDLVSLRAKGVSPHRSI